MTLGEHGALPDLGCLIPIVSQFGLLELPSKQLRMHGTFTDAPSDSFAEIMHLQLTALCTQFEANNKATPFTSCSTQDLDFHTMHSIIDQRNIAFDGSFNIDNPIAFAAGAKNNPDILSQGQMLKATDREKFIASQLPEIQGLVDADVFEFRSMSDLPPRACLLNAIWSYHRNAALMDTFSNIRVEYALMVPSNSMASIIGRLTLLSSIGA